ncbi:unnamed protein product [Aphanomyces euteiches]
MSPLMLIGIFTIPGFTSFPIPSLIKRRQAQDTLKKLLMQVIHDKLAAPLSNTPKDLLDMILPHATPQEAVCLTVTFILAGHDTSSHTLGFVFGMLNSHPQAIAGIRAEYNKVISKYRSLKSWDAVAELVYTQAVIQETLRINSVAFSLIQRAAEANDTVPMSDGSTVFIPKNEDLALWGGKSHTFHYMPFSMGSKGCIGQKFAMAELQLVVATLVSKYDFAPTAKMNIRQEFGGITTRPVHVEMTVRRVQAPSA